MRKLLDTFPKQHKMILAGASVFLLLAALIPADPAVASRSSTIVIADYANVDVGKAYPLPLQLPKATVLNLLIACKIFWDTISLQIVSMILIVRPKCYEINLERVNPHSLRESMWNVFLLLIFVETKS